MICIFGVPVAGITYLTASARHFFRGDRELVALSGADNEMALAAFADLAGDRTSEEAMLEPVDDKLFQKVERLADLPAANAL